MKNENIYKSDNIHIVPSQLRYAPTRTSLDNDYLKIKDNTLHVCFFDDITISNLHNSFESLIKEKSYLSYIKLKLPSKLFSIFPMLVVSLIAMFIGLFSAYGDAAYDLILALLNKNDNINQTLEVFLVFVFLVGFSIYIFPSILKAEGINAFLGKISGIYYNNAYYKKRFEQYLKILNQKTKIKNIVIHNSANKGFSSSLFWKYFIASCINTKMSIYLSIHHDELYKTKQIIEKIHKKLDYKNTQINLDFLHISTNEELPKEYLNSAEIQLLELLVFASTKNINIIEPKIKYEGYGLKKESVSSLEFVKFILKEFPDKFPDLSKVLDGTPLMIFFKRCIEDYNFLYPYAKYDRTLVCINNKSSLLKSIYENLQNELSFIYNFAYENTKEISNKTQDPVTILLLYTLHIQSNAYSNIKLYLIEKLILSIDEYEHYFLIKDFWKHVVEPYQASHIKLYSLISAKVSRRLAICAERSGEYLVAYEIHNFLKSLYPMHSNIAQARLLERQGYYEDAIEKLESIFKDYSFTLEDLQFNEKLKYLLTYSWVILGGRVKSHKKKGSLALNKAKEMIKNTYKIDNKNDQIWHYHNNTAGYYEWDKKYEDAINEYQECLNIPEVSQKWISGTLTNLGIAYRLQALENKSLKLFDVATQHAKTGVEIKVEIGDTDELPISLHNLALTYLCKSIYDQENKEDLILKAYETSKNALALNDTNIMILMEYFICNTYLKKDLGLIKTNLLNLVKEPDEIIYNIMEELLNIKISNQKQLKKYIEDTND